ncbi:MAG: hypothetical protein IJ549_03005 [Prevotella sp.]|nr:hypothetical protein [Prevotella sp.]MBQ9650936.1 hypothetical protein [Prevotella sp.]
MKSNDSETMNDITKQSRAYMRQQLQIIVALYLAGLIVRAVWQNEDIFVPSAVGALFMLVISQVYGRLWRRIATNSPDQLTTFYSATSGFRMLLALATMGIYYLVPGRGEMLVFVVVFMIFYMVCLAHHTIFFSRLTNRS